MPSTTFKIFNQGSRLFTYHEVQLPPGKFTTIPEQHIAGAKKLLEKYPTELVSAEVADHNATLLSKTVTELQTRLAEQTTEIERLKVKESPEAITALTARAEKAEAAERERSSALNYATDRIAELQRELTASYEKTAALTADMERLTAPTPPAKPAKS
jgi:hypothetical protein